MAKNLFKRIMGVDDTAIDEELVTELQTRDEDEATPRTPHKKMLASLRIAFFGENRATVDVGVSEEAETYAHQLTPRVRIVMEYYAEVLYRLGLSEASQQLVQYMGALCLHLLDEVELKRVNILGSLLELLYQKPENLEITYQQSVILFRNQDGSMEAEVQEPLLPEEYYLPTSVLLLLQNMLYTLGEDEMSCLIMAISAMHTFYATRYGYAQDEARRLASRHALQQVEANLSR